MHWVWNPGNPFQLQEFSLMRSRRHPHAFLLLAALACPVWSWAGDVKIDHAWVRATAPGQKVAGAFMAITADRDMELVAGTTPRADHVELHFMRMDGGVMEMRELESIKLPKGETVSLEPGGLHAMLIGLTSQVVAGEKVPMTLTFRDIQGKQENIGITQDAVSPRLRPLRRCGNLPHCRDTSRTLHSSRIETNKFPECFFRAGTDCPGGAAAATAYSPASGQGNERRHDEHYEHGSRPFGPGADRSCVIAVGVCGRGLAPYAHVAGKSGTGRRVPTGKTHAGDRGHHRRTGPDLARPGRKPDAPGFAFGRRRPTFFCPGRRQRRI